MATRPRIGVILEVDDLSRSRRFYETTIGLRVSKASEGSVGFEGLLSITETANPEAGTNQVGTRAPDAFQSSQTITIFMPRADLLALRDRLERIEAHVSAVGEYQGRQVFRCLDPDGNVLEFRETNGAR
jgi:catechol 2,3-dioxygenase-like lactoylglutathione lyase family enzyme